MAAERPRRTVRTLVAGLVLAVLAVPGVLAAAGVVELGGAGDGATSAWETAASADWPADAVLYHVFVDRFADGDAPRTQVAGSPADPDYAEALTDWMGGDLAGLEARLDHVVATGANTIWVSPVSAGPFFHGYHPTDLLDVDPRFGDVDGLRALVAAAQERGVRVVSDLVLNHTSDQHPWFQDAQADCSGSPYVDWYVFRECPDRYAAFAGLPELPQLNLDHPPARAWVLDEVLPFYLDDIGVDGFRLDHVEGPSRDFWRAFDAELAARWPDTFVLGEVWSQLAVIGSYGDVLDAATAFPLRERLLAVFAQGGDVRAVAMPVAALLEEGTGRLRPLGGDGPPWPQTYLSSHDQPRFAHLAGGDRARVALAHTAILTLPGVPTIYYGDEVGLAQTDALPDGAPFADRWFREPMPWDAEVWADWAAWDADLLERIAAVARLRTTTSALSNAGTYTEVVGAGDVWVFVRAAPDGEVRYLVALNNGEVEVDLRDVLTAAAAGAAGADADAPGSAATTDATGTAGDGPGGSPDGPASASAGEPATALLELLHGAEVVLPPAPWSPAVGTDRGDDRDASGGSPGTGPDRLAPAGSTVVPAVDALILRLPVPVR
ncbi:MAG: alpha-amylase family glycosyl hydrolase [Nitriliruptoraceae bacterium]